MDYTKPAEVVSAMIRAGVEKAGLARGDLLIRGALSGALLGIATSLAVATTIQTGLPIAGALLFPVGFVMIILLGLELVTGSFALLPLASLAGEIRFSAVLRGWGWGFLGNLLGSVAYALLLWVALTMAGTQHAGPMGDKIVAITALKTTAYAAAGSSGLLTAFVRGMLCNWMVCLGVVMGLTSSSTLAKIAAAWLPILTFFALGYEHSVVNMFMIPAGMLFGSKATVSDWWLWNEIPVTLGNLAGGFMFTALPLYLTYHKRARRAVTTAGSTGPVVL